jgi:hypothetical protein
MLMINDLAFDVEKYDSIIEKGLCKGLGSRNDNDTMCIEAAICYALDLPHSDDPKCVADAVRRYKIALNDKNWSSKTARAKGLRDLGIAQLGSKGVVNDAEFITLLAEKHIKVLIPKLFREIFPLNQSCLDAADRCEVEGSKDAVANAAAAANAANAAYAAYAANYANYAANAANYAANAANYANYAAGKNDEYLILSASLCLEVLRALKSPGCQYV